MKTKNQTSTTNMVIENSSLKVQTKERTDSQTSTPQEGKQTLLTLKIEREKSSSLFHWLISSILDITKKFKQIQKELKKLGDFEKKIKIEELQKDYFQKLNRLNQSDHKFETLQNIGQIIPPLTNKEIFLKYSLRKIIDEKLRNLKINYAYTQKDFTILNYDDKYSLMIHFNPSKKICTTKIISKEGSMVGFSVISNKEEINGILMLREKRGKNKNALDEIFSEENFRTSLRFADFKRGISYGLIQGTKKHEYGMGLRTNQEDFWFQIEDKVLVGGKIEKIKKNQYKYTVFQTKEEKGKMVEEETSTRNIGSQLTRLELDEEIIDFSCVTHRKGVFQKNYLFALTFDSLHIKSVDKEVKIFKIRSLVQMDSEFEIDDNDEINPERVFLFSDRDSVEVFISFRISDRQEYYLLHSNLFEEEFNFCKVYQISPDMVADNGEFIKFEKANFRVKELKLMKKKHGYILAAVYGHTFIDTKDLTMVKVDLPDFYQIRNFEEKKKLIQKKSDLGNDGKSENSFFRLRAIQLTYKPEDHNSPPIFALNAYDEHLGKDYQDCGTITYFNDKFEYFLIRTDDFSNFGKNEKNEKCTFGLKKKYIDEKINRDIMEKIKLN